MKTVLITGASGDIGRETALLFWRQGCQVAMHYFQHGENTALLASRLNQERPGSALPVFADIRSREDVDRMFCRIEDALGPADVVVNNAGISSQRLFTDISESEWDNMFDVHVKGTYLCCQRALPYMIHEKKGSIVNVSSMWGQVGGSCEVHYSAAKGAVIALTKALAMELAPSGIRVNCVAPGMIDTAMNGHLSVEDRLFLREEIPLGREGTPLEVAESIYFLASEKASFITGQVLAPNGGMVL